MTKKFNITNKKTGIRIPVIAVFEKWHSEEENVEVWSVNGMEMHFHPEEDMEYGCVVRFGLHNGRSKERLSQREIRRSGNINIFGRVIGRKYSAIRRTNRD
jgi:hypothetical protein